MTTEGDKPKRTGKFQQLAAQAPDVVVEKGEGVRLPPPPTLKSIKDIKREMARVYRGIYRGELTIQQAGSLIFMLDKIVKAIKDQVAVDTVQKEYQGAWTGFAIVAPSDADAKAIEQQKAVEILPPVTEGEEND